MNEQQAEFAKLKQDLLQSNVNKMEVGKETIELLALVHEAKRELLDRLYKEIQSM